MTAPDPLVLPGTVHVTLPDPTIHMVPVAGPPGPQGPPGDSTEVLGYRHVQSAPTMLVQIVHNLPFKPAGVTCLETDGTCIEYASIAHPIPGVTELTFGVAFAGTVDVS